PTERMVVAPNGNVGIGSINPAHKLDVNGTIHASEVLVDLNFPGPDYVFEEDYPLSSLSEIESYIKANKHLPEVPSAAQMKEEGVNIVQMQMLLLKKVEELTLHVIDLKKENSLLRDELELIKK
ncbi:MAG: cell surface protein, partial [Fulvivirga sp.]